MLTTVNVHVNVLATVGSCWACGVPGPGPGRGLPGADGRGDEGAESGSEHGPAPSPLVRAVGRAAFPKRHGPARSPAPGKLSPHGTPPPTDGLSSSRSETRAHKVSNRRLKCLGEESSRLPCPTWRDLDSGDNSFHLNSFSPLPGKWLLGVCKLHPHRKKGRGRETRNRPNSIRSLDFKVGTIYPAPTMGHSPRHVAPDSPPSRAGHGLRQHRPGEGTSTQRALAGGRGKLVI